MDSSTSVQALKDRVTSFCEERDWDQFHGPDQLSIGIITEAAELLELFRFKSPEEALAYSKTESGAQKIREELADVLFFVLRFSQMSGIDVSDILTRKLELNAAKYPVELSKGKNLKYTEI